MLSTQPCSSNYYFTIHLDKEHQNLGLTRIQTDLILGVEIFFLGLIAQKAFTVFEVSTMACAQLLGLESLIPVQLLS